MGEQVSYTTMTVKSVQLKHLIQIRVTVATNHLCSHLYLKAWTFMAIVPNRSFQKEFLTKNQNFYKQSLHNKPCRLAFITILQLDYITLQFRHKKKYSATIFFGIAASCITSSPWRVDNQAAASSISCIITSVIICC